MMRRKQLLAGAAAASLTPMVAGAQTLTALSVSTSPDEDARALLKKVME